MATDTAMEAQATCWDGIAPAEIERQCVVVRICALNYQAACFVDRDSE